jgi:hypothetical protein
VLAVGRFRVRRRRMREEGLWRFLVAEEVVLLAEPEPVEVPQPWPLHRGEVPS